MPSVINVSSRKGKSTPFSRDRFAGILVREGVTEQDTLTAAAALERRLAESGIKTITTDDIRYLSSVLTNEQIPRLAVNHIFTAHTPLLGGSSGGSAEGAGDEATVVTVVSRKQLSSPFCKFRFTGMLVRNGVSGDIAVAAADAVKDQLLQSGARQMSTDDIRYLGSLLTNERIPALAVDNAVSSFINSGGDNARSGSKSARKGQSRKG